MLCFHFPLPFYHFLLIIITIIQPYYFVACVPQQYGNTTLVEFLPGFDGPLPFHLETGYIGVDESKKVQLFYYFVKSESDPRKDPILIWLTGGPGCSSISGLLYEIGPLAFAQKTFNGSLPILVSAPYSWTKFASIIFLDQPLNTGFSITSTSKCTDDLQASNYVYEFLLKWFDDYTEFISNPFYVSGDSYSGIIIPVIVQLISDGNEAANKQLINIKGYTLGNPATFPEEKNYQIPFSHGMGLIPDELYESLKENCKGDYQNISPTNELCVQYLTMFKKLVSGIYDLHILEPLCGLDSPNQQQLFECFLYHYFPKERKTVEARVKISLQEELIMHVTMGPKSEKIERPWLRCRRTMKNTTYKMTLMNSIPYHINLSSEGYRSLIYSGDHDMLVPFQSTQAWIKSLNYSIIDDWRPWIVDGQVAGYTRSYSNHMTFATVKGGGHTAPEYKPKECYHMFKRWITQQPL
ncbi:serine carboxypeptidase-like 10 [Capsicum galapagoense]